MPDSPDRYEYALNVDLWKHDDTMRQNRNHTFMTVNSAGLVAAGLVVAATDELAIQGATALVAAVFGVISCDAWVTVQARHNAYIRFHRLKLVALEGTLGYSTYGDQERAFHGTQTVAIGPAGEAFTLGGRETKSSSEAEARLPLILTGLWVMIGLAGVAALIIGL